MVGHEVYIGRVSFRIAGSCTARSEVRRACHNIGLGGNLVLSLDADDRTAVLNRGGIRAGLRWPLRGSDLVICLPSRWPRHTGN